MPIIVSEIKTPLSAKKEEIISQAIKKAGLKNSDVVSSAINKTSLDARHNDDIKLVSSVCLSLSSEKLECQVSEKKGFKYYEEKEPVIVKGKLRQDGRIVVVGFGPAGMMASLILSENGYRPIVLERGASVDERVEAVENFFKNAFLDTTSNVQFGEGGAGTFSDGKLTTRIGDELCSYALKRFAEFGAPNEILTKSNPHIGTDKLRTVVKNIRNRIIDLGGEIRFNTKAEDFITENGRIKSVVTKDDEIKCSAVILAIGHSARDTFETLLKKGVFIEPKPFSVGARIEHKRVEVNKSLYGKNYDNPLLPEGEYKLSYREGERGVYTFCMCPGGYVVPSSSEEETVVTNGMSEFSRDAKNSNSAVVVSVSPDDFGKNALDGVDFARNIEKTAFVLGGKNYRAPAVSVGNFLDKKVGIDNLSVNPSYAIGIEKADFDKLFPSFITDMMRKGLVKFGNKMQCFKDRNALLTAPETRTSSPVRILRNEERTSVSLSNLYPTGEGAGYAGGIMSASVDGIKTAITIMKIYSEE